MEGEDWNKAANRESCPCQYHDQANAECNNYISLGTPAAFPYAAFYEDLVDGIITII